MSAPVRDWSLTSGERQISPVWGDANAAHRARYLWASDILRDRPVRFGADVFSATGYGTAHLADEIGGVWSGYDASAETIAVARDAHPSLTFHVAHFPCPLPVQAMDAVVSLESIEHIADDRAFVEALVQMLAIGGDLLVSVPNEARIPAATFGNRFHIRHYTPDAFHALFEGLGLACLGEYGQRIHRLIPGVSGMVRAGRVPDAEQVVLRDDAFASDPCCLLAHFRRVA